MDARLIEHGAEPGDWNMAVDEALLATAQRGGPPCLRFYGWTPATLSLGYFQVAADRDLHPPSLAVPLVRRATGGGAILHQHELTYSFTTAARARSHAETEALYVAFHETARDLLAQLGVTSNLWGPVAGETGSEPFLCFQRRARGDLVAGEHKLLGSAQRRARGGLLQHGSLLLQTSPHAPELPGLSELAPAVPDLDELRRQWIRRLGERLGLRWEASELMDLERETACQLRGGKFGSFAWTLRR